MSFRQTRFSSSGVSLPSLSSHVEMHDFASATAASTRGRWRLDLSAVDMFEGGVGEDEGEDLFFLEVSKYSII